MKNSPREERRHQQRVELRGTTEPFARAFLGRAEQRSSPLVLDRHAVLGVGDHDRVREVLEDIRQQRTVARRGGGGGYASGVTLEASDDTAQRSGEPSPQIHLLGSRAA